MDMVLLAKDSKKMGKDFTRAKNNQLCYGVVVIDIFSKLANVVPMKNTDGERAFSMA